MPWRGLELGTCCMADESANHYTMGSKDFGGKSNKSNFTLKYKKIMKLCSLPDTAHCGPAYVTFLKFFLTYKINEIFDSEKYDVNITGTSIVFLNGTKFLIKNLVLSLLLVIILISIFMAWMFNSFRMVVVSIIPNLIPLLLTGAIMGYFGIALKPSTALIFSIAFGISVDDSIHYLAKYRQELMANNWKIRRSVYAALRETGVSMFYTSIVLFFGFLVFTVSSFGGTIALGGLVSITLLFAMVSNLLLLPSLLLSLEKKIANKKTFKEPALDILTPEDTNGDK